MKNCIAALFHPLFWLFPPKNPEYLAWRDRIILQRLRFLWQLQVILFSIIYGIRLFRLLGGHIDIPFNVPSDPTYSTYELRIVLQSFLVVGYWSLQRTRWGKCHTQWLYLYLVWTTTLVPQFLLLPQKIMSYVDINSIGLYAVLTLLIPVGWRLHFISWLVPILFYAGLDLGMGFVVYEATKSNQFIESIPLAAWLSSIIVFCFCSFVVFINESIHRNEFEYRRRLGVLLHSVSHDLKTPVAGTSMVIESLLDSDAEQIKVSRKMLERLIQGRDRQLHLIDSLLEARNTEISKIQLHPESVQLGNLVQQVIADLEPVLAKQKVEISNRVRADLGAIAVDPTQIWRVYNNLISNALKHNPPGILITLDAEIVQSATLKNPRLAQPMLRAVVQDNGVGIPSTQQPMLFEPYSRGSRSRYIPGLGLGLYLCRQITQAHGGEIGVESSPNQGTTFWFTLPFAKQMP